MGTLTERLEFLLSMNSDQAIQGFKSVGDASEANLKKASGGLDTMGTKMLGAGAAMVAFSGLAFAGLPKTAEAASNAALVQEKLSNSVEHSTKMSQDATKAFTDLATSLRSEEHTSELQSHSFLSYAVF